MPVAGSYIRRKLLLIRTCGGRTWNAHHVEQFWRENRSGLHVVVDQQAGRDEAVVAGFAPIVVMVGSPGASPGLLSPLPH
jgi:hypothetical protein